MLFLLALPFCLTIASPVQDASNIGTDPGDVDYYSDPNAGESVDPYPDFVNIQNDQTGGYDDPDAQEPTSELPYTPGVKFAQEPSGSSATEPDPCQDEDLYCCHRSVVGTLKQSALNGLCFQCTQIPMKCDEQNQHCKSTVHLGYRSCCPLADGGVCIPSRKGIDMETRVSLLTGFTIRPNPTQTDNVRKSRARMGGTRAMKSIAARKSKAIHRPCELLDNKTYRKDSWV